MSANNAAPDNSAASRDPANPAHSRFVYANAGSGKTHVLTERIIRLLLEGVNPAKILALTYTKTAAATMMERVFAKLANFIALDDAALRQEIETMGVRAPSPALLRTARRLFARAVETPGGLKIQTIHAFCERVLQLFPFEANVPASFRVIEEDEQARLTLLAQAQFFKTLEANDANGLAIALKRVVTDAGSHFDKLIDEALTKHRSVWHKALTAHTPQDYGAKLTRALLRREGLSDNLDSASLENALLSDGLSAADWHEIGLVLKGGGKNDQTLANKITSLEQTLNQAAASAQISAALAEIFLTTSGTPRGQGKQKIISKDSQQRAPSVLPKLETARDHFYDEWQRLCVTRQCERSGALATLACALQGHYETLKAEQGALDFDDLILKTAALLSNQNAAFVLYKLDQGIDHILLDEAQDTAKEQWQILDLLSDEFGAGYSARPQSRTLFAVGDEKQSIYGFRGAVPAMFAEQRLSFAKKLGLDAELFRVQLRVSYRSARAILQAVDAVFAVADNFAGLSADQDTTTTAHEAHRRNLPGLVEIWPLVQTPKQESHDDANWALQASLDQENPAITLARRIAQLVKDLLDPAKGHHVHERGGQQEEITRPVQAGDIMILLRQRTGLFEAIIRMLKDFDIPVAGADRLTLGTHIAVEDMLALGRICLLPQDDVALASVLKSPLFGFDDEDLLRLATHRPGTLAEALAHSSKAKDQAAYSQLETWRTRALTQTPFAFYSTVLASAQGRRAYLARMGPEVDDVLSEFLRKALHYGTQDIAALSRFISAFEKDNSTIKRDLELTPHLVRVMTVHAAKGMEAKIVILPDTVNKREPGSHHSPKLWEIADEDDAPQDTQNNTPLLAWSTGKTAESALIAEARARYLKDVQGEHRRLLYVALTRAEERLYICGLAGKNMNAAHSWHSMVKTALEATGAVSDAPAFWAANETVWRYGDIAASQAALDDALATEQPAPQEHIGALPAWLWQDAKAETNPPPPLRPSNALAAADTAQDFALYGLPEEVEDGEDFSEAAEVAVIAPAQTSALSNGAEFGTLFHDLVAKLAGVTETKQAEVLAALLNAPSSHSASEQNTQQTDALQKTVLTFLRDPAVQIFLNAKTRFEMPLAGSLPYHDETGSFQITLAGRLDGLIIGSDALFLCDIKTGTRTAHKRQQALTQLALYAGLLTSLYPNHTLQAAILWANPIKVEHLLTAELNMACEQALAARASQIRQHRLTNAPRMIR